jgi:hypothetical protein
MVVLGMVVLGTVGVPVQSIKVHALPREDKSHGHAHWMVNKKTFRKKVSDSSYHGL